MSVELITTPAPADVPASLAEADALHETACDVYDVACRELRAARDAMTAACAAYTAADKAWVDAGEEMNAAAVALSAERRAAVLVLTADGYRQAGR